MVRNTVHVILAVILWIIFAWYWYLVGQRPINPESMTAIVVIGVLVLIAVLALTLWVLHNIRIFRKMQRRKARREPAGRPMQDYLGRWFVGEDLTALKKAGFIEVDVNVLNVGGKRVEEKVFRSGDQADGSVYVRSRTYTGNN